MQEDPDYIKYIKTMFIKYGFDYNECRELIEKSKLDSEMDFDFLHHFYYYICSPENIKEVYVRHELQIIGIASLIERLMSMDTKTGSKVYTNAFDYIFHEMGSKDSLTLDELKEIKEIYNEQHGSNRKIMKYFEDYMPAKIEYIKIYKYEKNKKTLEDHINGKKLLNTRAEIAKTIYQMRNDFAHRAKMRYFNQPDYVFSSLIIGDSPHTIESTMKDVLDIFEESYVNFWKNLVSGY